METLELSRTQVADLLTAIGESNNEVYKNAQLWLRIALSNNDANYFRFNSASYGDYCVIKTYESL